MRSHDGVISFSHPAQWASFTEAEKVLVPLYKRGDMRSHGGVVSFSLFALRATFTVGNKK